MVQETRSRSRSSVERVPTTLGFMSILSQPIRERIVSSLYDNVELSYTELLIIVNIDEGLLNFHLRKMKHLIKTTPEGTYMLSEYGKLAYQVLLDVENRIREIRTNATVGLVPLTTLRGDVLLRRFIAAVLDTSILFVSTGLFLDRNVVALLTALASLQLPSLSLVDLSYATVSEYSHIFFAAYLIFTILEGYKGQTLGKYLLGIRVVKVGGRRISLMDSAVRNLGKIFLLPLDVIIGILFCSKRGYLRFFDYYTGTTVERTSLAKSSMAI